MPRSAAHVALCLTILLGLSTQGCGHKSGRHLGVDAPPGVTPNLAAINTERHTMTVYVDDVKIGTVDSEDEEYYWIAPGYRHLEVRYGNSLQPRHDRGWHVFDDTTLVKVG